MPNNPKAKDNLKPFPKGVSGNPDGRPKNIDLKEVMDKVGGDEGIEDTVKALFKEGKKGNVNAIKEILDRYYGKTPQKTELSGGLDIKTNPKELTDEELAKYIASNQ